MSNMGTIDEDGPSGKKTQKTSFFEFACENIPEKCVECRDFCVFEKFEVALSIA